MSAPSGQIPQNFMTTALFTSTKESPLAGMSAHLGMHVRNSAPLTVWFPS